MPNYLKIQVSAARSCLWQPRTKVRGSHRTPCMSKVPKSISKMIKSSLNVPLQYNSRYNRKLGPRRFTMAHDVRPRLLCRRDDAPLSSALRPGPPGHLLPSLTPSIRCHDRRRYTDQQDGASTAPGL